MPNAFPTVASFVQLPSGTFSTGDVLRNCEKSDLGIFVGGLVALERAFRRKNDITILTAKPTTEPTLLIDLIKELSLEKTLVICFFFVLIELTKQTSSSIGTRRNQPLALMLFFLTNLFCLIRLRSECLLNEIVKMNFHSICMFRFLPTSYLSSLFFFVFLIHKEKQVYLPVDALIKQQNKKTRNVFTNIYVGRTISKIISSCLVFRIELISNPFECRIMLFCLFVSSIILIR